jgi:hypothetical protein
MRASASSRYLDYGKSRLYAIEEGHEGLRGWSAAGSHDSRARGCPLNWNAPGEETC